MSVKLKTKSVSLRIDVSDVEIDASNDETIRKSAECFRQAIVKKSGIPFYFLDNQHKARDFPRVQLT